ncbi:MAG: DUF2961 domain-containing protein [bacterium]|nr:DUF2961 domain-containing protein [bacterium]
MNLSRILCTVVMAIALAAPAMAQPAGAGLLDAVTQHQTYQARRESSSNEDLHKNGDARSIDPGETLVLGELEGPGVISHIWCTIGTADIFYGRNLVLRFYWDGLEQPSVEVPLGDFFGVGHGAYTSYTSLPAAVSSHGRARNCYWRMPFQKSARVTVTNDSDIRTDSFYYYLDWQKHDALPEDTAYFHGHYRQETPAKPGDYTILETTGRGHYVGTVLSTHQMELGWYGEGDDRFYIDGEETPSLRGTGTEDYFGDAWGFRQFSTPFYGVSLWEGYQAGDRVTAYRWHLPDPVTFTESLKVTIEHRGSAFTDAMGHLGQFLERSDWVSSVAFWYQSPAVAAGEALAPAAERIPPYRILLSNDLEATAKPEMLLAKTDEAIAYMPGVPDAQLDVTFEVAEKGRYQINAMMRHSLVGGIYQITLDDTALGGPKDFWMQGHELLWDRLGLVDLEAGTHTLRFEGRGASPNATQILPSYKALEVAALVLLRLEDMEGYLAASKAVQGKQ